MNDPTTPEGRAELRELHVLATDHGKETLATRHLTHPTIYVDHSDGNEDGLVGALPIWGNRYAELIVAAVNALPALLDALDKAQRDHEENLRAGIRHMHRAEAAEAALDRVRELVVWSDPVRLGGTPCVRGTRTPVDQITALLDDFSDEEISSYYPTPEVWQVAILRALDGDQ
ncbi:DUF433 domain-containing protein [Rhodococcus sp. HM1]|uniref:DUF433 domain-containing protein n=1 Tax=Rhodococcus sp. HM1 TaxID=2937759 RepID=UPI00200A75A3|nr:DUF433 domain-containing protein [Rhodococcus sp. HM1]MCK8674276.1 DUF433 domain-containing protein [Rhodococcus sp. HM1]